MPRTAPALTFTVSLPALARRALCAASTAEIVPWLVKVVPLPLDRSTTGDTVLAELSEPVLVLAAAVPASSAAPALAWVMFTVAALVTVPAVWAMMPIAPAPLPLIT